MRKTALPYVLASAFALSVGSAGAKPAAVTFEDLGEQLACLTAPGGDHAPQVILDQAAYDGLGRASHCPAGKAPTIDFSKKTLLGRYASGGGCKIGFKRAVTRDDRAKHVRYSIAVEEQGACKKRGSSRNWVLVPRIPADYSVDIEVLRP